MAQHPWAINKKNLTIMCLSIAINLTRYIDEKKTNNFMPALAFLLSKLKHYKN